MKKYLNTLYVTTQGAYLNKEGETVVITIDNEKKLQVPIHTIGGIVCFGQVSVSPFLMGFCAEKNVGITYLTAYGRFMASVHGESRGNVLLRREQYRWADDPVQSANIAKNIVIGKITNSKTVLSRTLRDHRDKVDTEKIEKAIEILTATLNTFVANPLTVDEIRGLEGVAARHYFSVLDDLIIHQKKEFRFNGRNRRPPRDNVNCLLSFLYTLIMHDVRSALEGVGLDAYVGFLHQDRPGRAGLALDMAEEFRSVIADRLALSLINLKQVDGTGFITSEAGGILMTDDTRKIVLTAYQKRKQEEIMHPFIEEKMEIGLLFHVQAALLARLIRGDLNEYPVFFWK